MKATVPDSFPGTSFLCDARSKASAFGPRGTNESGRLIPARHEALRLGVVNDERGGYIGWNGGVALKFVRDACALGVCVPGAPVNRGFGLA